MSTRNAIRLVFSVLLGATLALTLAALSGCGGGGEDDTDMQVGPPLCAAQPERCS